MIADNEPHDFELASGLPPGPHEVEIYKRSETQTGITQFLGFNFHGGKSLPSPPRQARKIEVMGDSFATGFGVENIDAPETDCPERLGREAGRTFASRGAPSSERPSTPRSTGSSIPPRASSTTIGRRTTIHSRLLRAVGSESGDRPSRRRSSISSSSIPDVIVMTQGSCDDGSAAFRAAYHDFIINQLRARGPNTHIFMGIVSAGNRDSVWDVAQEHRRRARRRR